ncbi:MAG: hypothetical protein ACKPHU_18185, partial [Planctomycetaceae bacterium]
MFRRNLWGGARVFEHEHEHEGARQRGCGGFVFWRGGLVMGMGRVRGLVVAGLLGAGGVVLADDG